MSWLAKRDSIPEVSVQQQQQQQQQQKKTPQQEEEERLGQLKSVGPWTVKKKLAKGAYGKIYQVTNTFTGQKAALKEILHGSDPAQQRALREAKVAVLINHPNVVSFYDVINGSSRTFIVMELAQEDLLTYLTRNPKLQEEEARVIFKGILQGLLHCHELSIAHRDIKLENILICEGLVPKLCDFGFCKLLSKTKNKRGQNSNKSPSTIVQCFTETFCGSLHYAAPELVLGNQAYDPRKADCWAVGCCLYALITRALPFCGEAQQVARRIVNGVFDRKKLGGCSPKVYDLIYKLITVDPFQRMSISEALCHPWITSENPKFRSRSSSVGSTLTSQSLYGIDDNDQERFFPQPTTLSSVVSKIWIDWSPVKPKPKRAALVSNQPLPEVVSN